MIRSDQGTGVGNMRTDRSENLADAPDKVPAWRPIQRMASAALAIGAIVWLGASGAQSQQGQGDWPCRQIKVVTVSPLSVWTGPPLETAAKTWREDPAVVPDHADPAGEDRVGRVGLIAGAEQALAPCDPHSLSADGDGPACLLREGEEGAEVQIGRHA